MWIICFHSSITQFYWRPRVIRSEKVNRDLASLNAKQILPLRKWRCFCVRKLDIYAQHTDDNKSKDHQPLDFIWRSNFPRIWRCYTLSKCNAHALIIIKFRCLCCHTMFLRLHLIKIDVSSIHLQLSQLNWWHGWSKYLSVNDVACDAKHVRFAFE